MKVLGPWGLISFLAFPTLLSASGNEPQGNPLAACPLIAHAMGAIDGFQYTNSLEAFNRNYAKGKRFFEVDLSLTSDGNLVCAHDGIEASLSLNMKFSQIPLREIKKHRFAGKYTVLDSRDLIELIKSHPDAYFITDTKDDFEKSMNQILKVAGENKSILDRIIPQIYAPQEQKVLMKLYPFRMTIFTLYRSGLSDDQVIAFVKASRISAVTASTERFNERLAKGLRQIGVPVFVHTVNDPEQIKRFRQRGACGFYTDTFVEN